MGQRVLHAKLIGLNPLGTGEPREGLAGRSCGLMGSWVAWVWVMESSSDSEAELVTQQLLRNRYHIT